MDDTKKSQIEKIYKNPTSIITIVGIIVTALLFKGLLIFADQGDLFMVVLMAVAIAAVAFILTKIISLSLTSKMK